MMKNGLLTVSALVSVILFPWPLSALLAVAAAFFEPLVPLAAGIFADTLYGAPGSGALPLFSLYGLAVSIAAVFVRNRVRASIIR